MSDFDFSFQDSAVSIEPEHNIESHIWNKPKHLKDLFDFMSREHYKNMQSASILKQ